MKKHLLSLRDIVLGKNQAVLSRCQEWVLPLVFCFSNLLNFVFYYLGLAFVNNAVREYGFILGCVLFAAVCGWVFLLTVLKKRLPASTWILLGLVTLFYGVSFAIGLLETSTRAVMFSNLKYFVFFGAPAFLVGVTSAINRTEESFFEVVEKLSFLGLPAAIIYMNGALFGCNPFQYGRNLGYLHYMNFAYTLMPLFMVMLVRFVENAPLTVPVLNKKLKHPQLMRSAMLICYWVALVGAATRGAFVCIAVFCVLLIISKLIRRESAVGAFVVSVVLLVVLCFNMFVYTPPGMQAINRMSVFLENLMQGQIVTGTNEREDINDLIDDLVDAQGGVQITNRPTDPTQRPTTKPTETKPVETKPTETKPVETKPTETKPAEPTELPIDIAEENVHLGNRGTLFSLAWGEFMKAPLTGMGPGGYTVKYGMYPHSVVMEVLAETGIVGSLFLLGLVVIAIVRMGIAGWQNKHIWYILIFFIAYAVQANISGELWDCPALMCALGYGLSLPIQKKNKLDA